MAFAGPTAAVYANGTPVQSLNVPSTVMRLKVLGTFVWASELKKPRTHALEMAIRIANVLSFLVFIFFDCFGFEYANLGGLNNKTPANESMQLRPPPARCACYLCFSHHSLKRP